MTKTQINTGSHKSRLCVYLEYILLGLCLCVTGLRVTITEAPAPQTVNLSLNLTDNLYSVSLWSVLILSFICWFVWAFCSRRFFYRLTWIEFGLCLFAVSAVAVGFVASDKRAAINDAVLFIGPVLSALLLVQILDSRLKIKLVLCVIAAFGVVSAYKCHEQFSITNQMDIEQYESAPDAMLEPFGIEAGSFNHMLFKHRLYSRDVRGFFTTSNSAGCFAMLASLAAIILVIETFRNHKIGWTGLAGLVLCGFAAVVVIFGLIITRSKGAIVASLIAAAMFAVYLSFGKWIRAHKKTILVTLLLLAMSAGGLVVIYGLNYGRLPGGNSILVRWQYWTGAAKMYADRPFTGVGGGNFAHFYPHYKIASASETVTDPHNFILMLLAQYGPFGLVGFLLMILLPLWRVIFCAGTESVENSKPLPKLIPAVYVIAISAALWIVRPLILLLPSTASPEEKYSAVIILYRLPIIIFILGFLFFVGSGLKKTKKQSSKIAICALFCAVLGVLLHNLIDYAIFEPGVSSCFWAILACLIALDFNSKNRKPFVRKMPVSAKILVASAAVAIVGLGYFYTFVPVYKSTDKMRQAREAVSRGDFEQAHEFLAAAAIDDKLNPGISSMNGKFYLQSFFDRTPKQVELLGKAEKCFLNAIERNKADFKNYERLAEVYNLLAESSKSAQRTDWLDKAFSSGEAAVGRYPGCGRIRLELAKVADQSGKEDYAIEQYKKTIEIEDSYRSQFRLMYPDREIFSRLGEEQYQFAKLRIKILSKKSTP